MVNNMNILIAASQNVYFNTRVFLYSLLKDNAGVSVYLLYSDLSDESIRQLKEDIKSYKNGSALYPVRIEESIFSAAPVSTVVTKEAYYRLLATDILPVSMKKVLYLDTDIIVNKSLTPLYSIHLGDRYAAACEDIAIRKNDVMRGIVFKKLKFEEEDFYFNSGVMLLNLPLIRRDWGGKRFLELIEKNKDMITYHDQDVLNFCFKNRVKKIDILYNCRPYLYDRECEEYILNKAYVIHFGHKPWKIGFEGICGKIFWQNALELGLYKEYVDFMFRKELGIGP